MRLKTIKRYSYFIVSFVLCISISYNVYLYHKYSHAVNKLMRTMDSSFIQGKSGFEAIDKAISKEENKTLNSIKKD